jgi:hypothetical protein
MGFSGSLFFSYSTTGHIRGADLAMIQLEFSAFPFPDPDVVPPSSAKASRAFSGVRMRFYNGFFSTIMVLVVFGTVLR